MCFSALHRIAGDAVWRVTESCVYDTHLDLAANEHGADRVTLHAKQQVLLVVDGKSSKAACWRPCTVAIG